MIIAEARFDRSTLGCMVALRRRLRQAMGVTVSLADPNAVEQMIELSITSREDDVRELGLRLAEMMMSQRAPEETAPASKSLIAAMRERLNSDSMAEPAETDSRAEARVHRASVGIYRGQIIRR
ncbi:hypothetical protein [Pseudomonas saliphila]|uniref:hypothetical protein n=1 Tax=Pseudomonas saliphila TaxID=2586906 RepID=UPI00123BC094|nr:hypothetical protein [Pseudomonas saliphila]